MNNTIKQAKHLTDAALGQYGTFRLWRSGVNKEGTYTWAADLIVNGKTYCGWGNTEEDARTDAAQKFKERKWDSDSSGGNFVRADNSRLTKAIMVSPNEWWKVEQKSMQNTLIMMSKEQKTITIEIGLEEPVKNLLLMEVIFVLANEKMDNESLKLSQEQINEYTKRLYPILSYSGLWNDHISEEELDAFYGVKEEPVGT